MCGTQGTEEEAMEQSQSAHPLIGRLAEQAVLEKAIERVREGHGSVLLVEGEAGIGKTRLVEVALKSAGMPALFGPSSETGPAVLSAPIAALLRSLLEASPGKLGQKLLSTHLAPLLPELGPVPQGVAGPSDSPGADAPEAVSLETASLGAAFREALRSAIRAGTRTAPMALVLEDLQWADHVTLGLLCPLARWLRDRPVLLIGTFRREGLPRRHPLRQAMLELRRAGGVEEMNVLPLDLSETRALADMVAGHPVSSSAAEFLQGRSEGVPLFVQELTRALLADGLLPGPGEAPVPVAGMDMAVPPALADLILLGLERHLPAVRAAAEMAAVLGATFSASLLLGLIADDQAFDVLTEAGLLSEDRGQVSFRRRMIRDAVYAGLSWARRRSLHRQVAAHLEGLAAPVLIAEPLLTAEHWLAGQDTERARQSFLVAADAFCRQHAYRGAAGAAGRALELWPAGEDQEQRLAVLDQLGRCAQACGMLAEAGVAWREAAQAHKQAGDLPGLAEAQHRLAGALELQGLWEQAMEARSAAADAYSATRQHAAAAEEWLAVGTFLRSASRPTAALAVLSRALTDARLSGRRDLEARVLGLEGNARARMGETRLGLLEVREGLAIALEGNFTAATADVLHRVADTLEHLGDYAGAKAAYTEALGLCDSDGSAAAFACRACATVPLYQNGNWNRAAAECRAVLASAAAPSGPRAVAGAMLGTVLAHRGQPTRARPVLAEALALSRQIGLVPAQLRALWGLALTEEASGHLSAAADWTRALLEVWQGVEDHYHVLFPLRWAASFFAAAGAADDLRRVTDALGRAANLNGGSVAYSALAHALGELACHEGHLELASRQWTVAVDLLRDSDTPFEEASTRFRAGQVRASLGRREEAVAELVAAHRAARGMNAVLLTRNTVQALAELGEMVRPRGGQGGAALVLAGLTRRQVEVLGLVAQGRSDKAIAQALHLSPRTVEMHVGRLLASLDSHSRTEAVSRAAAMGLLEQSALPPG